MLIQYNDIQREILFKKFKEYKADLVYAPAIEDGGNPTHNLIGEYADIVFDNVKHYMTYGSANYTKTKGSKLIIPTEEEKELKKKLLACYPSQMKISCRNFFNNPNATDYESFQ